MAEALKANIACVSLPRKEVAGLSGCDLKRMEGVTSLASGKGVQLFVVPLQLERRHLNQRECDWSACQLGHGTLESSGEVFVATW